MSLFNQALVISSATGTSECFCLNTSTWSIVGDRVSSKSRNQLRLKAVENLLWAVFANTLFSIVFSDRVADRLIGLIGRARADPRRA